MTLPVPETSAPIIAPLLVPSDPAPFSIVNPSGKAKALLICDHASNTIPEKLNNLGLSKESIKSHIAWDIGAARITELLSETLDATALFSGYSRLVVDVNRHLDHPTAFVVSTERGSISGNVKIPQKERDLRIKAIYDPYHEKIESLLKGFKNRHIVPAVISIHSFEPVFYNQVRPWDIGVLWVQDPRMPSSVIRYFRERGFTVGDNEPYDARILRDTTINHHADAERLPNVLVEIRNDLIDTEEKRQKWAGMLGDCFKMILQDETIHSLYDGAQVARDSVRECKYFDELIEKAKKGE